MPKPVMISDVRQRLFELFDHVVFHAGATVLIARKGRAERAVLISEESLSRLETEVHMLTTRLAAAHAPAPFTLIGSATLTVPADAILTASRAVQAELAAAKLRTIR